jgi:stress-induced morphogen
MDATLELITQAVRRAIPDARVFADSPDGRHFQAVVVSAAFEGQPLVRQHQLVMKALRHEFDSDRVHAMQLRTMTPEEFKVQSSRVPG